MKYDFDLVCIGLGPAGMAVSAMGAEMGLKVCAIEKNKIGALMAYLRKSEHKGLKFK